MEKSRIEKTGIMSLIRILSKNSEMQLPQKTLYKVLALIAGLGIMIPCTVIVGFISYVMTEALLEAGSPGGGMLFEMQILSAFSMIFGILIIFSVLFFSSDREHFVTLPIPAHHLMMSNPSYSEDGTPESHWEHLFAKDDGRNYNIEVAKLFSYAINL